MRRLCEAAVLQLQRICCLPSDELKAIASLCLEAWSRVCHHLWTPSWWWLLLVRLDLCAVPARTTNEAQRAHTASPRELVTSRTRREVLHGVPTGPIGRKS